MTRAAVLVLAAFVAACSGNGNESPADDSARTTTTSSPIETSTSSPDRPAAKPTAPGAHGAGRVSDRGQVASPDPRRQRAIEGIARLFQDGNHQVLDSIESTLRQYPSDQELIAWLERVEVRAQDSTRRQHQAAVTAGATAAPTFAEATQTEREALDLVRQGSTAASIRKLWEAEELFVNAVEWKADTAVTSGAPEAMRSATGTDTAVQVPLSALAQAYASLSAAAVKNVYPALSADEARTLDRSFLDYSAYRLDIRVTRTTFRGDRAVVDATMDTTVKLRTGSDRRSTTSATFVMERSNGAWVLASASRLPD